MIEIGLTFYSRPRYKIEVLKKFNDQYYQIKQTDLITNRITTNGLLTPEDIQNDLNNQTEIIKIVESEISFCNKQKEIEQRKELEKQQELEKQKFCYGFTDNMTPLQEGKILKVLNKSVRVDGNYTTRKEFIYIKVKEGYRPKIIDKLMTNIRKVNLERIATYKYNVPVIQDQNGSFYEITKTEYNYSLYLLENILQPAGV